MADNKQENKTGLDPEKLRNYRLKNGAHKLKNRSSKDILRINHCNKINSYKSMSREVLVSLGNNGDFNAKVELDRRMKKRAKKAAKNA